MQEGGQCILLLVSDPSSIELFIARVVNIPFPTVNMSCAGILFPCFIFFKFFKFFLSHRSGLVRSRALLNFQMFCSLSTLVLKRLCMISQANSVHRS